MDLVRALNVRLPDSMRESLRKCAKENGRTLNEEIIWRLRRSLEAYRQ